ncbi:MAG TPA: sigma-70 family RNA polymerase sigma factor [Anaerolineae bacterium]|nr:sigma-70 family RNA polymerase sigma factor [Anaerolineae bacterium]
MSALQDAHIVECVLGGDTNGYARLVDAYSERIINYLARMTGNRYEAEDLAQETFIRAFCALGTYKPEYKFSTWLFRIAHNQCINYLKKRSRLVHVDDYRNQDDEPAWVLADERPDCDPMYAAAQREVQAAVQTAIGELAPVYRTVVILRHVHGLSYQEIAKVVDVPIGTVKSRLGRARSQLADRLDGKV